jgi:hypothetical protein
MKTILALLVLMFTATVVEARLVRSWSYQELFDASDTVLVVTATKSRPLPDFDSPEGYGLVGACQVDFTVLGVFKGDRKKEATATFYTRPKSGVVVDNGPEFVTIETKENNRYLLFLKDGRPVSGNIDPGFSVRKLESWSSIP